MNSLIHAEMSNARSADIARNLKRHHAAPARPHTASQPNGRRFPRVLSSLLPLRHAA